MGSVVAALTEGRYRNRDWHTQSLFRTIRKKTHTKC